MKTLNPSSTRRLPVGWTIYIFQSWRAKNGAENGGSRMATIFEWLDPTSQTSSTESHLCLACFCAVSSSRIHAPRGQHWNRNSLKIDSGRNKDFTFLSFSFFCPVFRQKKSGQQSMILCKFPDPKTRSWASGENMPRGRNHPQNEPQFGNPWHRISDVVNRRIALVKWVYCELIISEKDRQTDPALPSFPLVYSRLQDVHGKLLFNVGNSR